MQKFKIGFIGLGKLGLPVALAIENKGHKIMGYDIDKKIIEYIKSQKIPYKEIHANRLLKKTKIKLGSISDVISFADIVFVTIQTPHHPMYEGITRIPKKRVDFNYTYLIKGVKDIAQAAKHLKKHTTLVIVSTVLPGTIEREIKPLLNEYIHLVYEPLFIAMGTTINDFLNPEFVLMGVEEDQPAKQLEEFYKTIHTKPVFHTDIKTAELIKVAYNTFIGLKIVFINTMMEICHKIGADIDSVSSAMSIATNRLISPKYLQGGMGDGGGCHPRDNIALSWLARKLHLSHDIFNDLMLARENQTEWLTDLIQDVQRKHKLPIIILGKSFKPETNLVIGSPAILLANILKEKKIPFSHYDPHLGEIISVYKRKAIYFLSTKHGIFKKYKFAKGSIVFDPFGYIADKPGVEIIHIGRQKTIH